MSGIPTLRCLFLFDSNIYPQRILRLQLITLQIFYLPRITFDSFLLFCGPFQFGNIESWVTVLVVLVYMRPFRAFRADSFGLVIRPLPTWLRSHDQNGGHQPSRIAHYWQARRLTNQPTALRKGKYNRILYLHLI